jgi:osmotically-inducible protein OsmY
MSTGCTTVVFNAARLAKEDRTTASQFADTQIGASVLSSLVEKDKNFLIGVNVDVWEARVLLTGTVSNSKTRQEVVMLELRRYCPSKPSESHSTPALCPVPPTHRSP